MTSSGRCNDSGSPQRGAAGPQDDVRGERVERGLKSRQGRQRRANGMPARRVASTAAGIAVSEHRQRWCSIPMPAMRTPRRWRRHAEAPLPSCPDAATVNRDARTDARGPRSAWPAAERSGRRRIGNDAWERSVPDRRRRAIRQFGLGPVCIQSACAPWQFVEIRDWNTTTVSSLSPRRRGDGSASVLHQRVACSRSLVAFASRDDTADISGSC